MPSILRATRAGERRLIIASHLHHRLNHTPITPGFDRNLLRPTGPMWSISDIRDYASKCSEVDDPFVFLSSYREQEEVPVQFETCHGIECILGGTIRLFMGCT